MASPATTVPPPVTVPPPATNAKVTVPPPATNAKVTVPPSATNAKVTAPPPVTTTAADILQTPPQNRASTEKTSQTLIEKKSNSTLIPKSKANFDEATMKSFRACFTAFDKSGTGNVTSDGLLSALQALHPNKTVTHSEVLGIMNTIDKNHNGTIDFDEFVGFIGSKMVSLDSAQYVDLIFEDFDLDQDGLIGVHDLMTLYVKEIGVNDISKAECGSFMKLFAKNGVSMTKAEFNKWMNSNISV